MARQLRIASASVHRPDERTTPAAQRVGTSVCINVISLDLKSQPVHTVRISEAAALDLIEQLVSAVNILRRNRGVG